jgi:hypothetical protein
METHYTHKVLRCLADYRKTPFLGVFLPNQARGDVGRFALQSGNHRTMLAVI